ncbi:MAG: amino acid adenylation domain-containing protein [Verrucomicrobiae bacterium]|nr:amino acid adenylation domain-containing protein [Verrucomicrobiae bacterium]
MRSEKPVIQISATFTAEPLRPALAFWLRELGIDLHIRFSGYNQVLQQALDPASESAANQEGFNVFLVRPDDLRAGNGAHGLADELTNALTGLASRSRATQLVIFCPHAEADPETTRFEAEVAENLAQLPNIEVNRVESWTQPSSVDSVFDPEADRSGRIPFTETFYATLATAIARRMSAHLRPPTKVLVLDADNTLWGGVCGEDGAEKLDLAGPWKSVRDFAIAKRTEGFLLCLCSKNSEADVDRVFETRAAELGLTRADFAGWKVNWQPKSSNLIELAGELNLGIDSFVFLDDNPAEIAEVAANCPGVVALTLPKDESEIPAFLKNLWSLDRVRLTEEDAKRAEFYQHEAERRQLNESAPSFADFLASLELKIDIHEATTAELPRISQLTLRTNQFNANGLRLSETELSERLEKGTRCLAVHVSDRFDDYGLAGAMLISTDFTVEGFMLSCRAMGKGVERAMVTRLAEETEAAGIAFLFSETERNEPCRRFFEGIGATRTSTGFTLPTSAAKSLPLIPIEPVAKTSGGMNGTAKRTSANLLSSELAHRIANELRHPERLLAQLQAGNLHPRPEIAQAFVKPGSKLENRIAEIWRNILCLETVGIGDPFSALGGTSVQLVRLHAQLQREFDRDIALTELFELPTIADQVRRIEAGAAAEKSVEVIEQIEKSDDDAVAIIGISLRVPGANDPDQFWENLAGGVESLSRFEREEIPEFEDYDKPGFVPVKGIIDDVDKFDAAFFGILPKDAKIMDPQQRIFLELAWEAMERAGYQPDNLRHRIGVYAGAYFDSYLLANLCTDREFLADLIPQIQVGSLQTELGNDKDYLATRVAFKLNLRGPAMTLQTACSTSMVAIVEACRAIQSGLCDMALAGGVTITLPLKRGYHYTEQGMLSGDGHCRAFDEKASGTVFGNGAGVIMLKRLSDAMRDRDHIHAVIRGTGMNNDGGVKHSYTAPSVEGQTDVIRMAHRDAGIDPRTISYIEAHGTGTPLGDPIEITALTKAFRAGGVEENQICAVGSLKTNIGHLDVASGVCGVIKTALSLEKAQLPPIVHFQKANPKIDFENSPFYVNTTLAPWKAGFENAPRRAGVSAFGVGGTNAHVIVEESPVIESKPSTRDSQLFLLSGRTDAALEQAATNLAAFAERSDNLDPADAAWTLAIGRKPFRCRRAVVAKDFADLKAQIAAGKGAKGIADRSNPPVNFMFPGQGAQHLDMARDFYESEPRFRELIDRCSEILRPHLGLNLTDVLFPGEGADRESASKQLKHTVLAQPAIFVIEYAMADLWQSWGIEPAAMIGHSVGEFVAACHAGVFDLESGLELLAARGRLMGDLPGGGMLSVRLAAEELKKRLPDSLDLAAVNGPALCVVAGPHEELDAFAKQLEADDIIAKPLHTSHAFHSWMMDPVIDRFAACFEKIELRAPSKPILSTVTGEWLTQAETTDPRYWAKHLRETVRFHDAVAILGAVQPDQVFLEVGPGQTLTGLARQTLNRKDGHFAVSTCRHVKEEGSDHANALESLGKLWTAGVEVNWEAFYGHETRKRVVLPTYPFERKRHWVDPKPMDAAAIPATVPPTPVALPVPAPEALPQQPDFSRTAMSTPENISRLDALGEAVRGILTDLSGIPEEDLAGDATFLELGFDSLLLTQVSKAFQDGFQTEITMRQLMAEVSTIDAMVNHLDATLAPDQYRDTQSIPVLETPASAPTPVTAAPQPAVPVQTPTIAPAPIPSFTPTSAGSGVESLVAQQLELMRQQLALLQGHPVAPAALPQAAPAPVAPVPAAPQPAPAPAPKPAAKSSSNGGNGSGSSSPDVSAPSTTISRDAETLTDQQQRHLDELIAKYIDKTRTSKELTAKYRQWYADPRTVSGFNRNWKEMIYQIAVKKSKGSRLLDIDGNEYIDLLNGFGPNFLGHSPDFVTKALHEQLDRGVEVGPQSVTAMEAAKLFCEITGNGRASFVNTGSEAVQAAMRLARTVTGRDKIVIFAKDYHGNFDEMLVRSVGEGDKRRSLPIAPGIPFRAVNDVIVLPYGSDEALEVIRNQASELAAVIVEPIQSRRPEFQPKDFIREVRAITERSGTVFVFDEVITGFRTGPRGAQEYYGVKADIATYGKVIGGGMPIGVVAGKAEYMDTFDGGIWQYGDDSFPEKGVTFFAGTFVRHPLAMAATKQVLTFLRDKGPEFWTTVRERANRLAGSVDRMFVENEAPFRMPNFGSQMFVRVTEDHKYANLLFFHLRQKGVFLLEGFPTYMTAAHTDEDVDYVIDAFTESVAELQEGGFFTRPAHLPAPHLNGSRLTGPKRLLTDVANPAVSEPEVQFVAQTSDDPGRLYPMTESLHEVWLASQASENASLCFNEVNTLTFSGPLDEAALKQAVQDVVARHEGLRAVYQADGEGFRVQPELTIEVPAKAVDSVDPIAADAEIEALLKAEQTTPFDLENGPLFRATLVRKNTDEHVLILNAHHLACDGWSFNLVTAELSQAYASRKNGETPQLEKPSRQFGDHAIETAWKEQQSDRSDSEAYWLERFADPVPPLSLPTDFATADEPDFRADTLAEQLDAETCRALKKAAGKSGATLFALVMSAYQALLHRISRQHRLAVAFPVAGQNSEGAQGLVGHCVNFLPFVSDIDPDQKFSAFVGDVQRHLLNALEHSDYTYGKLIKKLGIARSVGRSSLVEAVFNLERMDGYEEFAGVKTSIAEVDRRFTGNPLFLKGLESENGLELRFDFQTGLFSKETVRHWLASLRAILEKVIATPDATVSEIASSMADWQFDLLKSWNDTATDYPRDKSIIDLFDEVVAEHPRAVAIRLDDREISYREISDQADRFAAFLENNAKGSLQRVGLFLERTPDLIAAEFAILKTGAACVPLDPEYPCERLQFVLKDSGVDAVLTTESLKDRMPRDLNILLVEDASRTGKADLSQRTIEPNAPAFLLYTSGSTGTPKGAIIPHRAVNRLVRNTNLCELGRGEVILHPSSVCFDIMLFEIFGALLNGGTVALPTSGPINIEEITRCIRELGVTTLWLTSGLFQIMVEEDIDAFAGLTQLVTGGDVVSADHARRVLERHPALRLINGYGPTENTTFTTCHQIVTGDFNGRPLPIGRPLPNNSVWILDESGLPVSPCIPGELCCGGDGLALEYLNRPELTAERFFADPFSDSPGARLYHTGDLCRYRADGELEFFGRIDHQVKVRGFRVELGEIEARLLDFPKVHQVKVIAHGNDAGSKSLIAYASPLTGQSLTSAELADYLRSKLPAYMVPNTFVILDELPINRNGKIDRHALPIPEQLDETTDGEAHPGVNGNQPSPTEEALTVFWKEILRVREIGLDDDFFAMGGHSLLGMRLFSRIQRYLGISLPLAMLYKAPTIRQLGRVIDHGLEQEATESETEERETLPAEESPTKTTASPSEHVPAPLADTTIVVQPKGDQRPLFAVHGGDGGILFYCNLAERLGEHRPFYAFEAPALTAGGPIPDESVETTAARYVSELRKVQPEGPYLLCGYSFGGVVAYEMAHQLNAEGQEITFLGLIDTENPAAMVRKLSVAERVAFNWQKRNREDAGVMEKIGRLSKRVGTGIAYRLWFEVEGAAAKTLPPSKNTGWLRQAQIRTSYERAMDAYVPKPIDGQVTLFRAEQGNDKFDVGEDYGWGPLASRGVEVIDVPGNHITIFDKQNIDGFAEAFRDALSGVRV